MSRRGEIELLRKKNRELGEYAQRLCDENAYLKLLLARKQTEAEINEEHLHRTIEIINLLDKKGLISGLERCELCGAGDIEKTCPFCPNFNFCISCFSKLEDKEVLCPFCNSEGL